MEGAKAGHVVGLAFVALHKGTEYSADATGDINNHPLLARGICRELEDVIARISR